MIHRRHIVTGLTGLLALTSASAVRAYPAVTYAPRLWADLRDSNEVIVVNFRASWSLTCQIKEDILRDLLAEESRFRQLTFVNVDWDTFGRSEWVQRRLKVERRSTLLAIRGSDELSRLVNAPQKPLIRGFLEQALSA